MRCERGSILKKLLAALGVLALLCVGFVVFLWVRGGGPVVYSVGADRENDGGRASAGAWRFIPAKQVENYLKEDPEAYGGDWVLFPEPAVEE